MYVKGQWKLVVWHRHYPGNTAANQWGGRGNDWSIFWLEWAGIPCSVLLLFFAGASVQCVPLQLSSTRRISEINPRVGARVPITAYWVSAQRMWCHLQVMLWEFLLISVVKAIETKGNVQSVTMEAIFSVSLIARRQEIGVGTFLLGPGSWEAYLDHAQFI